MADDFYDYAGMDEEYQRTVRHFPLRLAPGFEFPERAPGHAQDGVEYAPGCGTVAAYFAWIDAVEKEAIRAHDAGRHDEAHRLLLLAASWPETDVYLAYNVPGDFDWLDGLIIPALQGEFGPLRDWVGQTNIATEQRRQHDDSSN
ncbi:hypothetical protein [Agrococcus casei]|uniref:hypothetical protein n=1 Tax=Agrococcus casei TaxID=343512 RepID=UPI000B35FFEB|nr:hypothetical protein [Agrococcus casei]